MRVTAPQVPAVIQIYKSLGAVEDKKKQRTSHETTACLGSANIASISFETPEGARRPQKRQATAFSGKSHCKFLQELSQVVEIMVEEGRVSPGNGVKVCTLCVHRSKDDREFHGHHHSDGGCQYRR